MEPHISDGAHLVEPSPSPPLNVTQLSPKVRGKLKGLDGWRVDASRLKLAANGPRVEGGFAVVCRASMMKSLIATDGVADAVIDLQSNVDVAVKMMKIKEGDDIYQVLRRAVREADIMKDLNHKNVITLEGFVEDIANRKIWLIFPWAEMGTVRNFVASKDWSIPERIWLIDDVTRGVEYLHSRNPPICHGDLKSINILVNDESRAIITDFGSARRLRSIRDVEEQEPRPAQEGTADDMTLSVEFTESTNTMTVTGTQYTLRWVAPEILGEEDAGTPADIWSMGWVFYEIMTGSIPFETLQNDAAIILHIVKGEFPSLKDHNRMSPILSLVSLMAMCWDITPERRPSAERCRKYVSRMPMSAPPSKNSPNTALEAARRLFREGMMYTLQDDFEKALTIFRDALKGLGGQAMSTEEGGDILWGIAEVHRLRSENDEAAALYNEVVRICEDIGDRKGKTDAQLGLAGSHMARAEYSEAAALYAEVAMIREELGDRRGKADAQCGLAEVHRLRDEYDEASAQYAEVAQIYEEVGDRAGKGNALLGLADVHRLRREYEQAATLYAEVVRVREELGDRAGKATAQWGLAEVHRLRHEYDDAAALYTEAAKICEEIGDRKGKAFAQRGLADIHRARDQYDEAAALYAEVVEIYEETGDLVGKASAQSGLAEVYRLRFEHDQAAALYTEVAHIYEEIGDRAGKADALWGLAEVFRFRDEYDEASSQYIKAMQIYEEIGDRIGKGNVLLGLADVHRLRREYEQAATLYAEVVRVREELGDRAGKATAQWGLAEVHRLRHEYDLAATQFAEVVRIREEIGDRTGKADAQRGLAKIHLSRKEYAESLQLFMESSQLSRAYGDKVRLAYSLRGLASVYDDQQRFTDAAKLYEQAAEVFTEIRMAEEASDALECATDTRRKETELQERYE